MSAPQISIWAKLAGRFGALAALALALTACAAGLPGIRFATDGGINRVGSSATGNYLAGRQASLNKDASSAAVYYARALRADPDNAAILERAFLLDVASGNVARGAALARKLQPDTPAGRLARLVLSVEALKKKRYADADAALATGKAEDESDVIWTTMRAWAHAGMDKVDDGLALLRAEDVRSALGAFGYFHEAMILEYAGRNHEAELAYATALSASQGRSLRVLDGFGRLLERDGKTSDAANLYQAYLAEVPGHPVVAAALARVQSGAKPPPPLAVSPAEGGAEALYGIAVVLAGERVLDLPVVYGQLALYLAPGLDPAHALLGDIYEQQENWALAVAAYSKIPKSSPVARLAAVSIARDLARLDKVDEAIALLNEWIEKGAADAETYVTLGDLYRTQENWVQAAAAYDSALKSIAPGDQRSWQIVYAKGISLERAGKWDEAEPLLRRALELEPDQPQVLNYLGYSWIDRGENLKEALSLIDRAVAQRPDDGYVVDSLGWAYYRLGDYKTAVYYLERAVELRAEDSTINDHLGDAYWRIGRRLEARFQWTHALAFGPTQEEAKAIKRKLEEGLADSSAPAGSGS